MRSCRPKQPAGSEGCRSINFSAPPGAALAKYFSGGVDECTQLGRRGSVSREIEEQAWFIDAGLREYLLQPTGAHILANQRLEQIRDAHALQRKFARI